MKYEVIKTDLPEIEGDEPKVHKFKIDDMVLFTDQPKNFRKKFNELSHDGQAEFDNARVILFTESGRVIICKNESYGI